MSKFVVIVLLCTYAIDCCSQDVYELTAKSICDCLESIDYTQKDSIFHHYEECSNESILKYESHFAESEGIDFSSAGSVEIMIAKLSNLVMTRCPASFSRIMEVIGNTTRNQVIEGRIMSIEQNRFLEVIVISRDSTLSQLIILNYFPEAKQKLEYILANQDKNYRLEFKNVSILDLDVGRFEDYLEITKIIVIN